MPHYYRVSSVTRNDAIAPDLPEEVTNWAGAYSEKTGNYVVRTDEAIPGYSDYKIGEDALPEYAKGLIPVEAPENP